MKKFVSVFIWVLVAMSISSGEVFAQAVHDNFIGIYLDEAAQENCGELPVGMHRGHLVLTELTAGEVWGWEATIAFTNLYPGSFEHRGQAIDIGTRVNEHVVGFATPLAATNGAVVVADFDFLVVNADLAYAEIGPVYFELLDDGFPAYLDGASVGLPLYPVELRPDPAGIDLIASFFVNSGTCHPVAAESVSFGTVKSLYR